MPTSSTDGTGQVPPTPQSPDGNGQVPPTSQDATSAQGDSGNSEPSSKLTYEQLEDRNKKLSAENAQRRVDAKRLAELEAAEQQRADAALSDKERYEKKIQALEAQVASERKAREESNILAEIRSLADRLGIAPKLASKLIERGDVTLDESGQPTNMAELFEAMLKEYPQLAASQQQPAPAANGAASSQQPVPQTGATNPPRGQTRVAANGIFGRDEMPRVTDNRLWKRG